MRSATALRKIVFGKTGVTFAESTRARASPAEEIETTLGAELAGRLAEFSGAGDTAVLTLAMELVREAQLRREIVAWITPRESSFYPPDAAAIGVDLEALVVVRLPSASKNGRPGANHQMIKAADRLVRSGSFGLVVLDMVSEGSLPLAQQGRLLQLAEKHHCPIVCLTEKSADAPSLGSLVGWRAQTHRKLDQASPSSNHGGATYACSLEILKDKRNNGLRDCAFRRNYHAPSGMR